jgi:outer membrane usher protein
MIGPALYGQLGSYSPRSIIYDAPDAPPGFDIGSGSTRVVSPYRGGYLVNVGSDYGLTAIGRLLSPDGEPLTFLSGTAIEQGGEGRRVDIFTNRAGTFGASGLKAGRWRIEMLGGAVYEINLPETPDGIARVGDLRPVK